ncbi:MAG TPA: 50S ribosomal protein L25 [Candidatus Paceibacterota bacterium]|nr:50S ribosomal protein L25 [Candidatus Paceibacterota bacterium]
MSKAQEKLELKAEKREILGARVRHLRKSGFIPAVLYGKGLASIPLQIPNKDFFKTFHVAGESTLVYINVDGQSFPTIIHDVARDPLTDDVIHADFYKVRLDEKIKTKVPVIFDGVSPAVQDKQGIFVRNVNELEVEAFPQDLPHEVKIDISTLVNFGDQVQVKNIDLGDKVKIIAEPEEIVATVQEPLSEEELKKMLEVQAPAVEEVEVIEKEKAVPEEELPETPAGPAPVAGAEKKPAEKPATEAKPPAKK